MAKPWKQIRPPRGGLDWPQTLAIGLIVVLCAVVAGALLSKAVYQ